MSNRSTLTRHSFAGLRDSRSGGRRRLSLIEPLETRRLLAVLTVDSLSDVTDAGDGLTTLREAVVAAAANDTIDLSGLTGTITLTQGEILLNKNLTFDGPGSDALAISGNDSSRIFRQSAGTVSLSDLTLRNGNASSGGAYYVNSAESVTFDRVIIRDSTGDNTGGGLAVFVTDATLRDSMIIGNRLVPTSSGHAPSGAGARLQDGSFLIERSTIAGNVIDGSAHASTTSYVPGLLVSLQSDSQETTIRDSTIANNRALDAVTNFPLGIMIQAYGHAAAIEITGTTISGNTANSGSMASAPVYVNTDGPLTFRDNLLANNSTASNGELEIQGLANLTITNNLFATGAPSYIATDGVDGNIVGTAANPIDAKLGTLGDHGGLTSTISLLAGSPALDAGSASASATDQRGVARHGQPDIGSYEYQNQAPTGATLNGDEISEGAAIGTLIGTAVAIDPDPGDTHTYSLVGDSPFAIDSATGELTLAQAIDYETATSHGITIRVIDEDGLSVDEHVTVTVLDVVPAVAPGDKPGRLIVTGTSNGDDDIELTLNGSGQTVVTINGESTTLAADAEAIYLDTGDGDDTVTLVAGGPAIWANLGDGNDTVIVTGTGGNASSFFVIDGGAGNDLLAGGDGPDYLIGGDDDDTLLGGSGGDRLDGGNGADSLDGGLGDDTLDGGLNDDILLGGGGVDTVSYMTRIASVTVNLLTGTAGEEGESDTLSAFEQILGGAGDDDLTGDNGRNFILGLAGDDTVRGGAGKDTLLGGAGADRFEGGDDVDTLLAVAGLGGDDSADTLLGGGGIDLALIDPDDEVDELGRSPFESIEGYLQYLATLT